MSSKSSWAAFVRSGGLDSYPPQEMDPPEKFDQLGMYWDEREFVLDGKVKFAASWGLQSKSLVWEYFGKSNFFHLACRSALPTDRLEDIIDLLISSKMGTDFNIDPCEDCNNWVDVFWDRHCKEEPTKKQASACLKKLGLTLPFQYEGLFNDELREFTHHRSTCGCYFCLAKPYEYEKKKEDWESVRASLKNAGYYDMISWEERAEYYEQRYNAKLWSIEEGRSSRPWDLPRDWVHPDDESFLKSYSNTTLPSKKLISETGKILTKALKCQRIPTLSELDGVMSKLTSNETVNGKTKKTTKTAGFIAPREITTFSTVDRTAFATTNVLTKPLLGTWKTGNSNNTSSIDLKCNPLTKEDDIMQKDTNAIITVKNSARPRRSVLDKVVSYNEQSSPSPSSEESEASSISSLFNKNNSNCLEKNGTSSKGMKNLSEFSVEEVLELDDDGDSDWSDCSEDNINTKNSSRIDDSCSHSDSGSMSLGSSGVESYTKSSHKGRKKGSSKNKSSKKTTICEKETAVKDPRNKSLSYAASKCFVPDEGDMAMLKAGWYTNTIIKKDIIWNENFDAMVCYGKKYGTCNVTQSSRCQLSDGRVIKLGIWLRDQRTNGNRKQLTNERLQKLQSLVDSNMLDWKLEAAEVCTDNNRWNEMYDQLVKYGEQHSDENCNVPRSYCVTLSDNTPCRLGRWLDDQRICYRKGILHEGRRQTLQRLVNEGKLKWKMTD